MKIGSGSLQWGNFKQQNEMVHVKGACTEGGTGWEKWLLFALVFLELYNQGKFIFSIALSIIWFQDKTVSSSP